MPDLLEGVPHWQVSFDKHGRPHGDQTFLNEVTKADLTDLLVFSHGWNNDPPRARRLYQNFFEKVHEVQRAQGSGDSRLGTVGVFWPAMRWPDESLPRGREAAASFGAPEPTEEDLFQQLKETFGSQDERRALDAMADLLERQPQSQESLAEFQSLLKALVHTQDETDADEAFVLTESPERLFESLAGLAPIRREGGAVGLGIGGPWQTLWHGAKQALRVTSYWQMKARAGVVGEQGLGPLIKSVHASAAGIRIHLVGHSFGARLVSFSLRGLPTSFVGTASPVKSLFLIQAAFSHFAFSESLPHDRGRRGALSGCGDRVHGPIVVTHSRHDTAVGRLYPWASRLHQEDQAVLADTGASRWGAMGSTGARAVGARSGPILPVGTTTYRFATGSFFNLDCNDLIRVGKPPSGAHNDIIHSELAWALLCAAGIQ